jgi:hypothetical protein
MRVLAVSLVASSVSLSVLLGALPVAGCLAEECGDTTVVLGGGSTPSVEVTATYAPWTGRAAVPGWVNTCTHELITGEEALDWLSPRGVTWSPTDVSPRFDPAGTWVMVRCPDHPNSVLAGDVYALYEPAEPTRRVVDLVVARAYDRTQLTPIEVVASPDGSPERPLLTQLPTWLWIDSGQWAPVSASASLPGITATVTAAPSDRVRWSLSGQGRRAALSVICDGPGVGYDFTLSEDRQHSDCTLTPVRTADADGASLSLRVTWDYAVACAPIACPVSLPAVVTESVQPVTIIEVRGVIIG